MKGCPNLLRVLLLCAFLGLRSQAQTEPNPSAEKKADAPTMIVAGLEVNDQTLMLRYEVRNGSENDIWICEDIGYWGFEVYLAEDGRTLMIRRRLDVPMVGYTEQPFGRYVRLRTGQSRTESFLLALPANQYAVLSGAGYTEKTVYAERVRLEIGYYSGDLPAMICSVLEKAEKVSDKSKDKNLADIRKYMGGLLFFNRLNEKLSQRDERVIVAYTFQALQGERVLSANLDGQKIPYIGKPQWPGSRPPDLSHCTRVDIRYEPSMLEYFFPYDGQRSLLSREETEYLHSEKTTIVDAPEDLRTLVNDVCASEGDYYTGGIVCERSMAHVVCYRDQELLTSFTVYDDTSMETEQKQRTKYRRVLECLRKLTPRIQPFELRMQCAGNVTNLLHRFRLYHKAQESRTAGPFLRVRWDRWRFYQKAEKAYPAPTKWCDAMEWAYGISGIFGEDFGRSFRCPDAGKGKSHYAMNPNCKRDSARDMVLLFETKAGWNQHGGPELFTFDNHDPKGGCVLLNDGTVKFIRTKEELQQLRWK